MKLLSMTATFGKLEQDTLTLEPGLNILQAPNEWGKSTWCAFLTAMLYGIETRPHSTKATLADKERYAPWSGSPMSGTLRVLWKGRDITIQRKTKGRTPLGEFLAFETDSGLPVPELNAANCGQLLLGVEKSVFLRSGFLRLSDLPVTQDDALRRRLNALVTTGDESGTGEHLARKLKELKNRCRFNRTGLLPQAESRQAQLEKDLAQLRSLQAQSQALKQRQGELETHGHALENHKKALEYRRSLTGSRKLLDAQETLEALRSRLSAQEALCRELPSREEADRRLARLRRLQDLADSTHMETQMLPAAPEPPPSHPVFSGTAPEEALSRATADTDTLTRLEAARKQTSPLLLFAPLLFLLAGVLLLILSQGLPGTVCLCFGLLLLGAFLILHRRTAAHNRRLEAERHQLLLKYGQLPPAEWISSAKAYARQLSAYRSAREAYEESRGDLSQRLQALKQQLLTLTEGASPSAFLEKWTDILAQHQALEELRRKYLQAKEYCATLSSAVKPVSPPSQPDPLDYSEEETATLLSDNFTQLRQLQLRQGQLLGQMDALGDENALLEALAQNRQRISRLEDTYSALLLAQETLAEAAQALQRRFAPRITQRTRELFSRLTNQRYDRVTLDENLNLSASTREEDLLRSALWRSDGTVDQLYLALRLAVAEALTPDAPLILDDALVRFDDQRLEAALEVLREEAETKQILLFTCQSRERQLLK